MIASKAIERDGKLVIITEIDTQGVHEYLNTKETRDGMLRDIRDEIVNQFLALKHEQILAGIDPAFVARLAQVELAQQTLAHIRDGRK